MQGPRKSRKAKDREEAGLSRPETAAVEAERDAEIDELVARFTRLPGTERTRELLATELSRQIRELQARLQVDHELIAQWIKEKGTPAVLARIGESNNLDYPGRHGGSVEDGAAPAASSGTDIGPLSRIAHRRTLAEYGVIEFRPRSNGGVGLWLTKKRGQQYFDAVEALKKRHLRFGERNNPGYTGQHHGWTVEAESAYIAAARKSKENGLSVTELDEAIEAKLAEKAARRETAGRTTEPPATLAARETYDQTIDTLDTGSPRLIAVNSVIRGASYIVGATSIMSILATIVSGAIIIQPALTLLLVIAAFGFYCMTLVKD